MITLKQKRCKEKHIWKYYGKKEKYNSARECLYCGLMQIYKVYTIYLTRYIDATKNEFNAILQIIKKENEKNIIKTKEFKIHLNQVEKDRLENLALIWEKKND